MLSVPLIPIKSLIYERIAFTIVRNYILYVKDKYKN